MKIEELAYIAGFIDGEGSITIAKNNQKDCLVPIYHLRVMITGTNKLPLDWVRERFGGSIMLRTKTAPRNKPLYQYCIASRQALHLLNLIEPFLILKKELARTGINFQSAKMKMPIGRPRIEKEILFMEQCRERVLGLNSTHTKKGGRRR